MVQDLRVGMSRNKSSRQLTHNVINKSGGLIKRWSVKSPKDNNKTIFHYHNATVLLEPND